MKCTNTTKSTLSTLFLALLLTTLAGCSGTDKTTTEEPAPDSDLTTVTAEDAARMPGRSFQSLIVQRVPGIQLTQTPDGRIQVRIRGTSNFRGDDQPLFVVDDMPVDPNPDGSLPGVPVTEIESIRVLKDPTDTAPYGMRGAYGVIVVTTKRGKGN